MDWTKGYVGMGREAVKGQAVSPAFYFPIRSFTYTGASPAAGLPSWGGGAKIPVPVIYGNQVRADVEASMDSMGAIFTQAYGPPESVALAGGLYQHVFFPGKTGHSATIETGQYSLAHVITGFHLMALNLVVVPGQRMGMAFGGGGMDGYPTAPRTVSSSLGDAPLWSRITLQVNSITDTTAINVTLALQNNWTMLAPDGAAGKAAGYYLTDLPTHVINATLMDVTSAWTSYARNRSEVNLTFRIDPAGASSASLIIAMPRTRLNEHQVSLTKGYNFPMQLSPFGATSAPRGASVTLINNVASY